ncbi:MAG TPA: DNA (cytosine-5-)-methyltransferase [Chitinophagaceae bacterium]|nr:DNA (cytosine-5-)-methyltransferase [Chitinophagaceae bacterium]
MPNLYPVIDLFCGVGGLSHGFVLEKFDLIAGVDFDLSCKYAYEKNNNAPFYHKNLTRTSSKFISSLFPPNAPRILVGCAPCQAFSPLSHKYKDNDKWKLLYSFGRIIKDVRPDVISMENVPRLLDYDNGNVFTDFCEILLSEGYDIYQRVVNAADYGVPQRRNRLILLASRLGKIELINETHKQEDHVTVWDAISHLPSIEAGEVSNKDELHRSRGLSDLNLKRILATPEGGGWKNWDKELILKCHKKETGKSFRSVYGRMKRNEVAPTLTTQCTGYGNGRYGHPIQNRGISLREAAILQSFPIAYDLINPTEKFSLRKLETHIGNAVPVLLGRVIAKSIKKHLKSIGY